MLTVQYFPNACYETLWQAMRDFTDARDENTPDECWIVEHQPVYTLGQNGKTEHILNSKNIPVVKTDRGGQVTYHGPGQLVVYVLLELKRYGLGIRQLVSLLENSVVALLEDHQIKAQARCDAPGVYVDDTKICSIGLRIRRGCSYHGLALNVNMDLSPFAGINPCGYEGMRMTELKALGLETTPFALAPQLIAKLKQQLKVSD
jgi:lipoyl(octanoyl) transferase